MCSAYKNLLDMLFLLCGRCLLTFPLVFVVFPQYLGRSVHEHILVLEAQFPMKVHHGVWNGEGIFVWRKKAVQVCCFLPDLFFTYHVCSFDIYFGVVVLVGEAIFCSSFIVVRWSLSC